MPNKKRGRWSKWTDVYMSLYFLTASLFFVLLYGRIRIEVKAEVSNIPSEVVFIGRFNNVVGYWAYGFFDVSLPYIGQDFLSFVFEESADDFNKRARKYRG